VALCGSVLRSSTIRELAGPYPQIVNDIGSNDLWPAVAEGFTWGYQATGCFGFNAYPVSDRWHDHCRHGDFFTVDFCERYWRPFFEHGKVIESGNEVRHSLLAKVWAWWGFKYLSWGAAIAGLAFVMREPFFWLISLTIALLGIVLGAIK
jgi:hypothetical protein